MILVHDEDDTPKAAALRSLRTLVADRDFVARMIDAAALTARAEGATLTEIGDALKITRSGALHMLRRAEGAND